MKDIFDENDLIYDFAHLTNIRRNHNILCENLIVKRVFRIYKKRLLLRCIHHSKSDFINNMDHMRISDTEPSSVVLSQRSNFKS